MDSNIQTIVKQWWQHSTESFRSAKREFETGNNLLAVNQIYNSIYYAVSAALLNKNKVFEKHSGVRADFHREFIKTGILDKELGIFFDEVYSDRQENVYLKHVTYDSSFVKQQLEKCEYFLIAIEDVTLSNINQS